MVQHQDYYLGRQVGNYRLLENLGSGTFGGVYRGEHIIFKDTVAVKILHANIRSEQEQDKFFQEARFLKTLQHLNILHILDAGLHEWICYIVMDLATGGSLANRLKQRPGQPLPLNDAITIIEQVGSALHYAHQHNIVHRDLKPDNILFDGNGNILLADFGIAVLLERTGSVDISGTPSYMAPEQFQGYASPKSDQYALGCIAYELLTGHRPFTAPDFISMGWKHANETITPLTRYNASISPHVEQAVIKAMAKERNQRFSDVSLFVTELCYKELRYKTVVLPKHEDTDFIADGEVEYLGDSVEYLGDSNKSNRTSYSVDDEDYKLAEEIRNAAKLRIAVAYDNKGDAFYNLKRYDDALVAYDHAIRFDPTSVYAYNGKGNALYALKRYDDALVAYDHALRLDPNYAYAYCGKGNALYALKRYDDALVAYDDALRLDPNNVDVYNSKGLMLFELERYDEALIAFNCTLRLTPDDAAAYRVKGMVLYELKRYKDALTTFDNALRLDPNFVAVYNIKGLTLQKLGKTREAQQMFDKARQLGYTG